MSNPVIIAMPPQRVAHRDPALAPAALDLLSEVDQRFAGRMDRLLMGRAAQRERLRRGDVERMPDTQHVRDTVWMVDPLPPNWMERRVELIGPADRRSMIEGMNSGAKTCIADLYDLGSGHPMQMLRAHRTIGRAARGTLSCIAPDGSRLRLHASSTTRISVAPRPLGVTEPMVRFGSRPVQAGLFDLVLLVMHHGQALLDKQNGIHLHLRQVQGHLEARLWNHVFDTLEEACGLDRGSIRATVFVDSVNAALEAEEILFELSAHAGGLALDNAAYVADHIALFTGREGGVFPDRERFGMDCGMLEALARTVIGAAHRRGTHALGTPGHGLPHAGPGRPKPALLEMLNDKEHEAALGMDGTIMAHPGLVNAAMTAFNKHMGASHQLGVHRPEAAVGELVQRPEGEISVDGLVRAIRTGLLGFAAMEAGIARIELDGRTHDRSSVHLALSLLWQWVVADKGRVSASGLDIHDDLITFLVRKEVDKLAAREEAPSRHLLEAAGQRLNAQVLGALRPTLD